MIKPDAELEKKLYEQGFRDIVGLDEAGRGPWAGPLTTGAVVLNERFELLDGVADSKKLSEKKRESLFDQIRASVKAFGVGVVSSQEIDTLGVSAAVNLGMQRAILQVEEMIGNKAHYLIIDGGTTPIQGYPQQKIIKGDMLHYSISAASILAKVTRDRIMKEYAKQFPEYFFEKHVGYGTKLHSQALAEFGPCELHRFSYKPIYSIIEESDDEQKGRWKYWGRISSRISS
jgi:ribonuclease HII